jgi:hypothetical protein
MSVTFYHYYAECRYVECHYAKCHGAAIPVSIFSLAFSVRVFCLKLRERKRSNGLKSFKVLLKFCGSNGGLRSRTALRQN